MHSQFVGAQQFYDPLGFEENDFYENVAKQQQQQVEEQQKRNAQRTEIEFRKAETQNPTTSSASTLPNATKLVHISSNTQIPASSQQRGGSSSSSSKWDAVDTTDKKRKESSNSAANFFQSKRGRF